MSRLLPILFAALLSLPAWTVDQPSVPISGCNFADKADAACAPSPKDLKRAKKEFERGIKLKESKKTAQAYDAFEEAARLSPQNLEFATAREITRQQLVYDHIQRGNNFLLDKRGVEALAEFREAVQLDPANQFANQRLRDAIGTSAPGPVSDFKILEDSPIMKVAPLPGLQTFHYRGDTRGLYQAITAAFGITVMFDDAVTARRVRFDVERIDFYQAMKLAGEVTKTFWTPLSGKQVLIAPDTPENHRTYDRLALRTFLVPDAAGKEQLTEVVNALKAVFELKFITSNSDSSTITVRAPAAMIETITAFLESISGSKPQVLLEVQAFEVDHNLLRQLGVKLPLQYNLFNISSAVLASLGGGQNIQQLINQLIANGGINQANSTSLQALIAQLQNQQTSIFSQPVATFGGGITLFGLAIPTTSATASINESTLKSLEHITLRAAQGNAATFRVGQRYPVLNAIFSPTFNSPALSKVIQNNTFTAPFPSFNYVDLGISLKATPQIHGTADVTLQLELETSSLGSGSFNGVPVINNRHYSGSINVKNDTSAVMVGIINKFDSKTLTGPPGLGHLPVIGRAFDNQNVDLEEDELLVLVTPHILTAAHPSSDMVMMSDSR